MNVLTQYQGDIASPEAIATQLETVFDMVKASLPEEMQATVRKMLAVQSRNVRTLFEFKVDDAGKMRPANVGQLMFLTDIVIGAGLAPSSYNNDPKKVFIGMLKALEIGTEPITGLSNIMLVNNRPSVWGDLAQALVERSGQVTKQKVTELGTKPAPGTELAKWPDDYGFRVETWRKGQDEPYVGEYTVARAKRAHLWMNTKKQPWITDPERMLFNRARAFSLRDGFADCLYGMGIIEEQRDIESETALAAAQPARLPSPADDDEPVTAEDAAAALPDYGDDTELPSGEAPQDQGAETDPPQQKEE